MGLWNETDRSRGGNHPQRESDIRHPTGLWRMEGLVGIPWRKDGGGGDSRRGVEARDMGGTGDAHRGGAAGGDGGMGLSCFPSYDALLPLPCGERTLGTEGA